MAANNSYSRLVAWLKIILPLAALAILSTLFLISRAVDPSQAIQISEKDIAELAKEQRIGAPSYSGVTEDGTAVTLSAAAVKPDPTNPMVLSADNLLAEMQTKTGLGVQILSKAGMINAQEKVAALTDGVRLATTTGYLIKTESVTARLDTTNIVTSGGVSATGPLGSITAGDMEFRMKSAENGTDSFQLVFKNGVKLVYLPPKKEVDSK